MVAMLPFEARLTCGAAVLPRNLPELGNLPVMGPQSTPEHSHTAYKEGQEFWISLSLQYIEVLEEILLSQSATLSCSCRLIHNG